MGFDIVQEASAAVRQNIGYVPQLLSADGELSAYENLMLSATLYGLPRRTAETKIKELLDFMGLTDVAHQLVSSYSGGMIRRLEIARLLCMNQPFFFLTNLPLVWILPRGKRYGIIYKYGKDNLIPQSC